ncbi:hypothetical protein Tco_0461523, partial [Tanacetum coccineum]
KAKEKLALICSERVVLEDLIRKASSDYPGDRKFVELQENDGDDDDNDDDDFDKQPSEGTDAEKESVDPTQEGTVVEGNPAEECDIMNTLENYTQWLERNAYLGDLFGDNSMRMEVSNKGLPTSDRMPTRASYASASPEKQIAKPSSYLLSPDVFQKL